MEILWWTVPVAILGWGWLFLPSPQGFWLRAFAVAGALAAGATVTLVVTGRLATVIGSLTLVDVVLGLATAGAVYGGLRLVYPLAVRFLPGLARHADRLYDLRRHADIATVTTATVVLGVGEELFFRGVVQDHAGVVAAVVVYAGIQLLARNPVLIILGIAGALVWGGLFTWRGSLVAPVIAHVVPIAVIVVFPPPGLADARATGASRASGSARWRG